MNKPVDGDFAPISRFSFDRVDYDAMGDVLYLHVGDRSRGVDFDETPEGHAVRLDGDGNVIGLTLVRPKRLLERYGELRVTLPMRSNVSVEQVASAFG